MSKKVLLTGAAGFFGRACLPFLRQRNFKVYAVASSTARFLANEDVCWLQCDLLSAAQTKALLSELQPDFLLHAAWCRAIPGAFWDDADNARWTRASLELLEMFAQNGGRRAAIAGTGAEYDWRAGGVCHEERTPLQPASPYGISKLELFAAASAWARNSHCSLAWGRLFFLYGPHEHPRRLVASIIRSLLRNEPAQCSAGEQQRDFLHIEDAANLFVALLDSDIEGAINIASGEAVAVKTIALQIAELAGRRDLLKLGALPTAPGEAPLVVADVARLHAELLPGALPAQRYDLRSGLQQTLGWWKENL